MVGCGRCMRGVATVVMQQAGPVYNALLSRLTERLAPSLLVIENESHRHKSRGEAESHFKVLVVSAAFENVAVIDRHRLVNKAVSDGAGVLPCHALAIKALTPAQFEARPGVLSEFATPPCLGGDGGGSSRKV